jgi:ADP-heptose:LPS heptosyltransferase
LDIQKILVFNPFGIGDVLFSTPLVRNLKTKFPKAAIDYLCNRRSAPLLELNPFLNKVMIFEKDEWRRTLKRSKLSFIKEYINFYRKIRLNSYDLMFDLSMNSQYGLFFKLAGIPARIGYDYKGRGRFRPIQQNYPAVSESSILPAITCNY